MTKFDVPYLDMQSVYDADDPHTTLAKALDNGWIAQSEYGLHILTYDAGMEMAQDDRFHFGIPQLLDQANLTDPVVREQWTSALTGGMGDAHTRRRRLLAPYFSSRTVAPFEGFVKDLTAELAASADADGTMEFASGFSQIMPAALFCYIVGAPVSDGPRVAGWSDRILQFFQRKPELAPEVEAAHYEIFDYFDTLIAQRRSMDRGDDMISALLNAEESERISPAELRALIVELLIGSHDNTDSQISLLLYAAARYPEEWQIMRQDPSAIPAFIDEVFRFWPRAIHFFRSSEQEILFRGITIPANYPAFITIPTANRDPSKYEEPHKFNPRRTEKVHNMQFGAGRHHCIGALLVRMELRAIMEVLTERWETVELAGDPDISASFAHVLVRNLPLRVTGPTVAAREK